MRDAAAYATHEVLNQAAPLGDYDAFAADPALPAAVEVFGAGAARERLGAVGRRVASFEVQENARLANRHTPELVSHDRFGNRIDRVEFHPAWHGLMTAAMADGVHALAWTSRAHGHLERAATFFLWTQGESGILCPLSMTHAAIPVIRQSEQAKATWEALLLARIYDPQQGPAAAKSAATCGMAMTEKQGGSDLRQTQSEAVSNGDGTWSITGHKWFFSVPHSDVFLTLARTEKGVSCFVVAGWLEDGTRNRILIQRLKEKCGNRSNASSEVEFRGAVGRLVGEEGRGIATILEMGHLTRIDCAVGSAALMRQALSHAAHHCATRSAFQRRIIDQPIMQNVIADLEVETEAATWLALRAAHAVDAAAADEREEKLARILAPVAKYWICKRVTGVVVEALECHGGNGFIEDHLLARLYRDAPLNGVWEGSGNVICLDALRALARDPATGAALHDELRRARGVDRRYDGMLDRLESEFSALARNEGQARRLMERLALALSASLLVRHGDPAVADAFLAARLGEGFSGHFGDLPVGVDAGALARRALPVS